MRFGFPARQTSRCLELAILGAPQPVAEGGDAQSSQMAYLYMFLTMQTSKKALFPLVALALAACNFYGAPPHAVGSPNTDFVVDKTFDQVWTDLTALALLKSLPIRGYEKGLVCCLCV